MTTNQTDKATLPVESRTPLNWLVVNPQGMILAVLDSESEAYWFTRNRGHANGAVYFKAELDYIRAVNEYAALVRVADISGKYLTEKATRLELVSALNALAVVRESGVGK